MIPPEAGPASAIGLHIAIDFEGRLCAWFDPVNAIGSGGDLGLSGVAVFGAGEGV